MALISQAAARYRPDGGREHCSICRHFVALRGGSCKRVEGRISPRGWCKLFSQEVRARIPDVTTFSGGGGGPALGLDFMVPGVLDPRITFTRASTATYFDSAGVMQSAAVNAPRWDYDPATLALRGLLLEDQRTNGIRNSTMVGAVPGSPGTMPTNWLVGGSPAVTPQVVGTGTESGIPYIDIRLTGTAASTSLQILPEGTTAIVAANGQAWTNSMYIRLVAGTLNGITALQQLTNETTAAGAAVKANFSPTIQVTSTPLALQRLVYAVTLTGGGTVGMVHPRIQWNTTNGAAIEATFRIGAPQLELGDFATSYIPTTSAAVTRSIDSCLIPPANMAPWFVAPGGSWFAEFDFFDNTPTSSRVVGRPDASGGHGAVFTNPSRLVGQFDSASSMVTANATTVNAITKAATTWATGQAKACSNGSTVATSAALTTGYAVYATSGIRLMSVGPALAADNTSGHLRQFRYWPTILSDAQMQAMTA